MQKVALLFPGQGNQYVGMGKSLIESSDTVKNIFSEAEEILGYNLNDLIENGDMERLTCTEYAQPAIFTYSYAIYRSLSEKYSISPYYLCGHSLGEITALTCAGYFSFRDGLKLVKERGRLMQQATANGFGGMAAINGLNPVLVEEECAEVSDEQNHIAVANYNSSSQVVISGEKTLVKKAGENLLKLGASVIELKVSAPFHTSYMEPANREFINLLSETPTGTPVYPVIANVDASPYDSQENVKSKLGMQMINSVQWKNSIEFLLRQGVNTFIELGPKSSLSKMIKREFSHVRAYSYENDYDDVIRVLEQQDIEERPNLVSRCLAIAVCTRNQNWNEEEYQKGVVEPYRKVQEISNQIESEGRAETEEEMKQAVDMLCSVFETKHTPIEEQKERFTQIFYETRKRNLFKEFALKY